MSIFLPIIASTIFGVLGQLILKLGMNRMGAVSLRGSLSKTLLSIALNPFVIGGLIIYCLGVFFWLVVLSIAPLSYAYPFASLSYILITLVAIFVLREKVSFLRLTGILLTCSGVLVVALS